MKKVSLISLAVLNCAMFIAGANAQSLSSVAETVRRNCRTHQIAGGQVVP